MRHSGSVAGLAALLVISGCSREASSPEPDGRDPLSVGSPAQPSTSEPATSEPATSEPATSESPAPETESEVEVEVVEPIGPDDLDLRPALDVVRQLAGVTGARQATSRAYDRAASWVGDRLDRLGDTVRRQRVDVPAGTSWGVPVAAGRSVNVIAWPPGWPPGSPTSWSAPTSTLSREHPARRTAPRESA